MKIGVRTSLVLLVVVSVTLAAYLGVGILKLDPFTGTRTVTVSMASSGGLLPKSRVLYNGVEVGTVESVAVQPDSVRARLSVTSRYSIPADATVTVENLSLVGEQYLNFTSTTGRGPYLSDGAVISRPVVPAATVGDTLTTVQRLIGQVDTARLTSIANSINAGWIGRDDDITRLGEFAGYFSRSVTTRRTEFSALFDHAQQLVTRLDGSDRKLTVGARALATGLPSFTMLWALFPGLAKASAGAVGWTQTVTPFVATLSAYLQKLLPPLTPVLRVLLPLVQTTSPSTAVDVSALVRKGLRIVDSDGVVRFGVDLDAPEGK
ncbi:MlaD family protein [Williamsia sp. CHRR-6]|uniref:MlaD family protein n=1 Tax=Williamsia sp. CHRR-6 TaxID=2835871 RepID=UPI001BDB54AE|nr:MlaD family protein [Williamsia sp. CHRR-6]MBT0566577.1 MCE family protein [Williamsia sp. CHRR-6]